MLFLSEKVVFAGLTFDDALLFHLHSKGSPQAVNFTCRVSRSNTMNAPLVSIAMHTVTKNKTAITIASEEKVSVTCKKLK